MQLTTFSDYGLRALIYLATLPKDKKTNITEVTEIYGVSRNHMVKVINQLSKHGFVNAIRGKNGGLVLGMAAHEICVGDVIRALEPLTLLNCSEENCHITSACRLKPVLKRAINAFLSELDQYTIADLVSDNPPLYKLLLS